MLRTRAEVDPARVGGVAAGKGCRPGTQPFAGWRGPTADMLRILLAHSYFLRFDQKQWERGKPYPPLATLQVAAMLRALGHEVVLFDAMLADGVDEYVDALGAARPDVVVLYEDNFNFLTKMCLDRMHEAACRMVGEAAASGARVIVAGSDASDRPRPLLDAGDLRSRHVHVVAARLHSGNDRLPERAATEPLLHAHHAGPGRAAVHHPGQPDELGPHLRSRYRALDTAHHRQRGEREDDALPRRVLRAREDAPRGRRLLRTRHQSQRSAETTPTAAVPPFSYANTPSATKCIHSAAIAAPQASSTRRTSRLLAAVPRAETTCLGLIIRRFNRVVAVVTRGRPRCGAARRRAARPRDLAAAAARPAP